MAKRQGRYVGTIR